MTKSEKARAIITGSYILFLIDGLLDNSEKTKGSTIMLKQRLLSKTRKAQNMDYVVISNEAWANLIELYKDKRVSVVIFDAVEHLAFNEEEAMIKMFGQDFFDILWRFVSKQTPDKIEKEILKESREVVDVLTEQMKKLVYDKIIRGEK